MCETTCFDVSHTYLFNLRINFLENAFEQFYYKVDALQKQFSFLHCTVQRPENTTYPTRRLFKFKHMFISVCIHIYLMLSIFSASQMEADLFIVQAILSTSNSHHQHCERWGLWMAKSKLRNVKNRRKNAEIFDLRLLL